MVIFQNYCILFLLIFPAFCFYSFVFGICLLLLPIRLIPLSLWSIMMIIPLHTLYLTLMTFMLVHTIILLASITPIYAFSVISSNPLLCSLILVLFFGNSYVISAGSVISTMGLLHSDLKDKKIEPVDPADVTITLISDAFLLLEYIGSDITYIGDGYMLCVLFSMLYSSSELPRDLP